MSNELDMQQLLASMTNQIRAQMERDLSGRHTRTHTAFGKPMVCVRRPEAEGRHRKSPPWLNELIGSVYQYAEDVSAENISRSSGGIVVPAQRRGFELDMLVMDEADRLNDE